MVTTFTEKAARELQDRITAYAAWIARNARPEDVADIDVTHIRIGTLHAICNDVLQEFRYPPYQNVRLMDEIEQLIFVNEHSNLAQTQPAPRSREEQIWATFSGLLGGFPNMSDQQRMRNRLWRAKGATALFGRLVEYRVDLGRMREAGGMWERLADGYQDYVDKLNLMRRSDFSHVQATFLQFLSDPKGRQFLEGSGTPDEPGIAHVLVDEYQDTNPIQAAIYFQLAARLPHNLMVVGDDDQAIYRFRGGTVESLIAFNEACGRAWGISPGTVIPMPLYDNFRSQRHIVDWCNHYISAFPEMRPPGARAPGKQLLQPRSRINSDALDYPSVNLITGPRLADVARVFALAVRELLDNGVVSDPSDIALLMRSTRETRTWAQPYVDALAAQNIRAFNPRAKSFLNQEEVQASLGALLAIIDPGLSACPPRAQQVLNMARAWDQTYQRVATTSRTLARYVEEARAQIASRGPQERLNTGVMELFYILLSFEPFAGWQGDIERSLRLAKLTRILEAYTAMPYENDPERTRNWLFTSQAGGSASWRWRTSFYWGLASVLQQEGLDDEEDEYVPFPPGRLPIMTIFQAKGLQFPFVFVGTTENDRPTVSGTHQAEELLQPFRAEPPLEFNADQRAVQDQVRLFYVAHSRAQYGLTLLATHKQRDNDAPHLGPRGAACIIDSGGIDLTLLPVRST